MDTTIGDDLSFLRESSLSSTVNLFDLLLYDPSAVSSVSLVPFLPEILSLSNTTPSESSFVKRLFDKDLNNQMIFFLAYTSDFH